MLELIANLFFKVGLSTIGNSFFKPFLAHLDATAKIDGEKFKDATGADREVAIAQVQATVAAAHDRAGMRVTQWLIAIALLPPLLHSGMVYLDSSPFPGLDWSAWVPTITPHVIGSWHVPKAPPPYDEREWLMISALLGIQSATMTGLGALRMLAKR